LQDLASGEDPFAVLKRSFIMTGKRSLPWPGMALTAIGAVALLVTGVSLWLILGIATLWVGSLWISQPEPHSFTTTPDVGEATHDAMAELIEPIGFPLILLNMQRIVLANAAARSALGAHIVGQDARIALRHPEAMRLLEMTDGDSVMIPGFTGGRSLWQLTRRRIDTRLWLIELHDRTSEADVSRAHTDFVANASHELRTPLSAIIGYVETLSESGQEVDPETTSRFLQTVLREARRMQTLVSDLMSLSQVEAEKHDLPTDDIDLGKLVERVVGEATAIAGKERVALSVPQESSTVHGERTQLEQLVRNLVDNSLKYGDTHKPVSVDLALNDNDELVLTVADKGAGIAPEHIPLLTRRFYRTDPGRSRQAGGTGLGLAIVKHIVERHRARLDIESTLGEGTTIRVTFSAVSKPVASLS
jgi:two-component system phosphate regulon sensor histidine kinase PhoR